ncbi:MAG: tetratricopeptide repeat protein [Candidatus Adiutrix sp.]
MALPPDLALGQITGQGHQAFSRALGPKNTPKSPTRFLNGHLTIVQSHENQQQTVIVTKAYGPPETVYKPDPFTKRLWKVTQKPTEIQSENHELVRFTGQIIFDWFISDKLTAAPREEGQLSLDLELSYGGFLATQNQSPPLKSPEILAKNMELQLATHMAHLVGLTFSTPTGAHALETASNPPMAQAHALAAAGSWDQAKDIWLEILGQNPTYSPALYNLGVYWEKKESLPQAWDYYRQAFISDGSEHHRQTLGRLAEIMASSGQQRRAPAKVRFPHEN